MCARWYRPPEIILLEPSYDDKVDIWSLGCIFSELAYIWDNPENEVSDRYLFKGSSCYPLSPVHNKAENTDVMKVSSDDQIVKILERLGPQPDETLKDFNTNQMSYIN